MFSLCDTCSILNISGANAFCSSPFIENRMHQWGSYNDVASRTGCPLCSLVAKAYLEGPIAEENLCTSTVQACWTKISNDSADACISFWLVPAAYHTKILLTVRLLVNEEEEFLGAGRLLDPGSSEVDLTQAREWVNLCEKTHNCRTVPLYQTRMQRLPKLFTVINVVDGCLERIEQFDNDCRYIALSYVW